MYRKEPKAMNSVRIPRSFLAGTEEILALTEVACNAATSDFTSLQDARLEPPEARLALIGELYTRQTTLIQIEYAGGEI
jgi:hypothetical protein